MKVAHIIRARSNCFSDYFAKITYTPVYRLFFQQVWGYENLHADLKKQEFSYQPAQHAIEATNVFPK
jgi:hypothetical protein